MAQPKPPKKICPYCLRVHGKESAARRCLAEVRSWKKSNGHSLVTSRDYLTSLEGKLLRYIAGQWPKEGEKDAYNT